MFTTIVLLSVVLIATATDLLRRKIYNWTTYSGALVALWLSAVGSLATGDGVGEEQLRALGWIPLADSLAGFFACGFVMVVCFVFFNIGGGDVKLMAMLGAFLGPQQGIMAMLWTFVFGGCMGLVVLIWQMGSVRLLGRALRQVLWSLRIGGWSPLTESERAQLQVPLFLAPSALAAVMVVRLSLDQYVPVF